MGKAIAAALGRPHVVLMDASEFQATDILPADACFLGCDQPKPASFNELERVLQGMNLANRPCGVFSPASKDAIDYLRSLVGPSELRLNPKPLLGDKKDDVAGWVKETIARS